MAMLFSAALLEGGEIHVDGIDHKTIVNNAKHDRARKNGTRDLLSIHVMAIVELDVWVSRSRSIR
jgi:hypothetical protein